MSHGRSYAGRGHGRPRWSAGDPQSACYLREVGPHRNEWAVLFVVFATNDDKGPVWQSDAGTVCSNRKFNSYGLYVMASHNFQDTGFFDHNEYTNFSALYDPSPSTLIPS
jgi:hypothetical protein